MAFLRLAVLAATGRLASPLECGSSSSPLFPSVDTAWYEATEEGESTGSCFWILQICDAGASI